MILYGYTVSPRSIRHPSLQETASAVMVGEPDINQIN